jgi:hypothetical protein
MEQKIIVADILRNFIVRSEQRMEDITASQLLTMSPKEGVRVKLTARE